MENSQIEWCDHTFNPWEGCTKVSAGCKNCYAETRNKRFGGGTAPNWGKGAPRRRTSPDNWKQPRKWDAAQLDANAEAMGCYRALFPKSAVSPYRPKVFCASLADWLDDEVPIEWLADLLVLISECRRLDWLLLTKRPENLRKRICAATAFIQGTKCVAAPMDLRWYAITKWLIRWLDGEPPCNIWLGTSAEDQSQLEHRAALLMGIPAHQRFLSIEPLLGPIDLRQILAYRKTSLDGAVTNRRAIDWVIVGGESGPNARECCTEFIWSIVRQCREEDTPVFVKQLGARPYTTNLNAMDWPEKTLTRRCLTSWGHSAGTGISLKHPKGGDMSEWPTELRVQQMPQ